MVDTSVQSESSLSNATKSLARTLQDQLGNLKTQVGTKNQVSVPEDILRDQDVFLKLRNHIGFPSYTDSLAYDAGKKLLAVGTKCGRVKLIGSDGVECLVGEEDSTDFIAEHDIDCEGFKVNTSTASSIPEAFIFIAEAEIPHTHMEPSLYPTAKQLPFSPIQHAHVGIRPCPDLSPMGVVHMILSALTSYMEASDALYT